MQGKNPSKNDRVSPLAEIKTVPYSVPYFTKQEQKMTKPATKNPRNKKTYIPIDLPAEGLVRLPTFARTLGVSPNTITNRIKEGRYPPGILLGKRTRAWDVAEIRELLEKIKRGEA